MSLPKIINQENGTIHQRKPKEEDRAIPDG